MGEQNCDGLSHIHATPAADAQDDLRCEARRLADAIRYGLSRQIRLGLVVNERFQPVAFEIGNHGLEVRVAAETGVSANQSALAKLFRNSAQCVPLTGAKENGSRQPNSAEQAHRISVPGARGQHPISYMIELPRPLVENGAAYGCWGRWVF